MKSLNLPTELGPCLEQICQLLESNGAHFGHGTDNAWDEACWLVSTLLQRQGTSSFNAGDTISGSTINDIENILLKRLEEKIPLAYLLGEAWFAGYRFCVDERVLVPRSPFAELICGHFSPFLDSPPRRVLDLCTGSGCIGIACALEFPDSEVVLADISAPALEVACNNIDLHQLQSRVTVCESDLFARIEGKFDLILSNPPYVSNAEYGGLPKEYEREPELGLVSRDAGLELPLGIISGARQYLAEDGLLFMEVGNNDAALQARFPAHPLLWLEFEHGGHGVCVIKASELEKLAG